MWPQLSIPRFAPNIEQEFQASYYDRVRPLLRLVSGALAVTIVVYLVLGWHRFNAFISVSSTPYLLFCLLLYGLTYAPAFGRVWQSVTVGLAWLEAAAMLFWLARAQAQPPPFITDTRLFEIIIHLIFRLQTCVLMVGVAALRLQFRPSLALQGGVVGAGLVVSLFVMPLDQDLPNAIMRFMEPVFLVLLAVLLAAYVQEQLARSAFEANRQLALLQAQEHEKRLETEKMLHILNSAIGGIVHDLGNPLTRVQSGSELVERMLRDGDDPATLLEVNDMVLGGAKMLNYLRLSLIEQSRVLEGRPVPVELKPVAVRAIVEAGVSFQNSRFMHGHTLTLEAQDFTICADEMKLVTVLMNLIGNALKYSDGPVRVAWQPHQSSLLLAVLDAGKAERGLTQEQASRLFTPFGRLETHANIEGTGLGLLSVQKIVEAHGGEVWIEGFEDGTGDAPRFSTARANYPSLLASPYRTAFALTCPLVASTTS